jgi:hypothetical protein
MSDNRIPEDENEATEKEKRAPLSSDLRAARIIGPSFVVLYMYLMFTSSGLAMKFISAAVVLFFAAGTTLVWRIEPPTQE